MRRKGNENEVSELIDLFLNQYGLKSKYKEFKMAQIWSTLMGPMIAKHTKEVKMYNGTLYVDLDSAPMRNELSFAKSRIIKNLNDEVGEDLVKDLVFR